MDLLGGAGIVWALPIMKARKTVLIMHSFSYTSKHQTLSQIWSKKPLRVFLETIFTLGFRARPNPFRVTLKGLGRAPAL